MKSFIYIKDIINNLNKSLYHSIFRKDNRVMHYGRFTNYYDNRTEKKVDYNNLDHCGPCGLDELKIKNNR